jgi:5-methylcytosine-specific restriction protein A
MQLQPGRVYQRKDLHAYFGGQRQGGIVTPKARPVILLFSSPKGEAYGYREEERGPYLYVGEFAYTGHFWSWNTDVHGTLRKVLTFVLEPINAVREGPETKLTPEQELLLQQGRLAGKPPVREAIVKRYGRSSFVAEQTLSRAQGRCELCGSPAPFVDLNEEPFLEVHHIIPLSEGGTDDLKNTAALCPNCHRAVHYANNAPELQQKLISKLVFL